MGLTNIKVKNSKVDEGKNTKTLSDSNGLYLKVDKKSNKTWIFRFTFNGERKTQGLGSYPAVSLLAARKQALESKELVAKGINPIEHKTELKKQATASENLSADNNHIKFRDVYDEFCKFKTTAYGSNEPAWQYQTLKKHNERIFKYVMPELGNKNLDSITEPQIRKVLLQIQSHEVLGSLKKIKGVLNGMFDYALGKNYTSVNPVIQIPKSVFAEHKPKNFKYLTTIEEVQTFLTTLDSIQASYQVQQALRFGILTFLRPTNIVNLKWSQIDFKSNLITIDAAEMKSNKEFLIPLSTQVVALLNEIRPLTRHTEYVFCSPHSIGKPISRDSLSNALRRNGIDNISPHGFRHTASTILHDEGFSSDVIEAQLSHEIPGVKGVYNKAKYLEQRKELLQLWSDKLFPNEPTA